MIYKLFLFLFSTIPDLIEASLLTILITNFRFLEQMSFDREWDYFGFFFLSVVDGFLVFF